MRYFNKSVVYFEMIDNSVDSNIFRSYVSKLILKLKTDERYRNYYEQKLITILIDNASIHCSNDFLNRYGDNISLLYNAPYYSIFNAVEYFFSYLKKRMMNFDFATPHDLKNRAREVIENMRESHCRGAVIKSMKMIIEEIQEL